MNITFGKYVLALACFSMMSCIGESDNEGVFFDLQLPGSDRHVLAIGDNSKLRADITINYSPFPQTFDFESINSPRSVIVEGIQLGDQNFIRIVWSEVVNGHVIELSEQNQSFFAEGETLISATHEHTNYDYDRDGVSNFDERIAGTCVWLSNESCDDEANLDIPTDNGIINGDFSDGDNYWFSRWDGDPQVTGEYCAKSLASAEQYWEAYVGHSRKIHIEAHTRYRIVFDVKAEIASEVRVGVRVVEPRLTLFSTVIDVSTTYQTKSIIFDHADNAYSDVDFGFSFGNGMDNQYCFDNVKLIREASL